jgi:acetyl esterase/lipase
VAVIKRSFDSPRGWSGNFSWGTIRVTRSGDREEICKSTRPRTLGSFRLGPIPKMIGVVLVSSLFIPCFAQIPIDRPLTRTPTLPDSVTLLRDIPYDKYPDTKLDILQLKQPSSGKHPGVIIIHGGGWINGDKDERLEYAGMKWVEEGFVAAVVNYRLASVATAPAAITDVLTAAQWFRDHASDYGVDPKRIVVTGESAGAHLALMVAFTPASAGLGPVGDVAAVINFCAITDVTEQIEGPHATDYAKAWLPEQPNRSELARKVSPITYVRKGLPPVFTIHGDNDPLVPYSQSVRLTEALRKAGDQAELITVPQNTHGFTIVSLDDVFAKIFAFLRSQGILK